VRTGLPREGTEQAMPDGVEQVSSPQRRGWLSWMWRRELKRYPSTGLRTRNLVIVVLATMVLYYELYASSGVSPLLLAGLGMSFLYSGVSM
jgi:hypothetical protein